MIGKPFYVDILLCADGRYYVGQTDDLENRLWEHQQGGKCAYTSVRRPIVLVWSQEFPTREEAKEAEAQIKKWGHAKKQALISGDFSYLSQLAKKDLSGYRTRERLRAGE